MRFGSGRCTWECVWGGVQVDALRRRAGGWERVTGGEGALECDLGGEGRCGERVCGGEVRGREYEGARLGVCFGWRGTLLGVCFGAARGPWEYERRGWSVFGVVRDVAGSVLGWVRDCGREREGRGGERVGVVTDVAGVCFWAARGRLGV